MDSLKKVTDRSDARCLSLSDARRIRLLNRRALLFILWPMNKKLGT